MFTSTAEKNSSRVGSFLPLLPLAFGYCLNLNILKTWFAFDSFCSQPRKLSDHSAQRLGFLGLLALHYQWGGQPRCLLQSPSLMAFSFYRDIKISFLSE